MMNPAYVRVIASSDAERLEVFLATASRLGTAVENVEKDFWVCWTLDALFNGPQETHPRLLFKGGTSLSKSFGLIDRFSEDIDITVFRNDLGQGASIEELEALSGKKRRARLDAIKEACGMFINGVFLERFRKSLAETMIAAGMATERYSVEGDDADPDRQTLLFRYGEQQGLSEAALVQVLGTLIVAMRAGYAAGHLLQCWSFSSEGVGINWTGPSAQDADWTWTTLLQRPTPSRDGQT